MSGILINVAAEFTGKKAFKDADKSIGNLQGSVKGLGKALATVFAAEKIVSFGKASMKAFVEDEKAARMLANTVKNLGLGFESVRLEDFIQSLSKSAGVSDDQLRPAMQKLITTTRSAYKSQQLLTKAIDISRGSGVDLVTVAQDLASAYVGNTRGLKKYNLGLSQTELKALSFSEVQEKLNELFSGASAEYLTTYAGKLDVLSVSMENAKESIGKGLFDAIAKGSGGTTAADATQGIENVTNAVNGLTSAVGSVVGVFTTLYRIIDKSTKAAADALYVALSFGTAYNEVYGSQAGRYQDKDIQARQHAAYGAAAARKEEEKAAKAKAKADKAEASAAANKAKIEKALLAEQKKQLALKKAGSIFDLQQIELIAALKGNVSAEDRKRLELQLALATGNLDEAKKLTYELAISQGLTVELAKSLADLPPANNPFAGWKGYLDEIELQAKRIAAFGTGGGGTPSPTKVATVIVPPNLPETVYNPNTYVGSSTYADTSAFDMPSTKYNKNTYASSSAFVDRQIVVQIDGKAVATAIQNQNNSGNTTGFTRLGSFGTP